MLNIIQTFWQPKGNDNILLNNGGFLCPEIHWMAWAFSCLQLRKFYPDVELHTNQIGKEILIDTLGLPYTKVHLSLENDFMQNLHPKMWAYSKIHTYSIQKEPFLHVDGDVFIWKAFDGALMQSGLIAQNIENNLDIYHKSLSVIEKYATYKPDWLAYAQQHPKAYNAGVLGSSDLKFIKEYTDLAFEFYNKNEKQLDSLITEDKNLNTIAEQYLFYVLSEQLHKKVSVFTNQEVCVQDDFKQFVEIEKIPFDSKYLHTLGSFKKSKSINDFICFALKTEHPEYWAKIISVFKEKSILSEYISRYLDTQDSSHEKIPAQSNLEGDYRETKQLCEFFNIDFESNVNVGFKNNIINESFLNETRVKKFGQTEYFKHKIKSAPFPFYKKETNIVEFEDFRDYYIFITPYHQIDFARYDWSKITMNSQYDKTSELNPFMEYKISFLDVYNYSFNQITTNKLLFELIETLKTKPFSVKDIFKKDEVKLLDLLKTWYAYGFIYFSKSKKDFIPQEPSPIYLEHQSNLNTQIKTCFEQVLNHYKLTDYKEKLISKFDNTKKSISFHDIIKVLEKLNFETKGVKGDLASLSQIPLPAITLVKLRDYLPLYVVITKVSDTHVTIFNTELKEEESYTKDYFQTIWDGILILMLPKT